MQWFKKAALCGAAAMMSACVTAGGLPSSKAQIKVTESEVRQELDFLGPEMQKRFLSSPAELQKLIETLYFRQRMEQLADQFKYQDDAKLQALMQRDREYRLADWVPRRYVENLQMPDLTEEALAYYKANPTKFTPKEAIHLQGIFLQATDDGSRKKRRPEAERLHAQLKAGADFGALAEAHSEDGGRFLQGDLGDNIMPGELAPEVEMVAFALSVGEMSDVLESPYGFHILKLLGRRQAAVLPFQRVVEPIMNDLQSEYRKKALEEWMDEVSPASASELSAEELDRMAATLKAEFEVDRPKISVPTADRR